MAGVRVTRVRRRDDTVDDKVGVIGDGRVYAVLRLRVDGLDELLAVDRADAVTDLEIVRYDLLGGG